MPFKIFDIFKRKLSEPESPLKKEKTLEPREDAPQSKILIDRGEGHKFILSKQPLGKYVSYSSYHHEFYEADLRNFTCTCDHHRFARENFTKDDISYLCRHLNGYLEEQEVDVILKPENEMIEFYLNFQRQHWFPIGTEFKNLFIDGNHILVVQDFYNDWIDVIARVKKTDDGLLFNGPIRRFALQADQVHWAKGDAPPNAKKIKEEISKLPIIFNGHKIDHRNESLNLEFLEKSLKNEAILPDRVFESIREILSSSYEKDFICELLSCLTLAKHPRDKKFVDLCINQAFNFLCNGDNRSETVLSFIDKNDPYFQRKWADLLEDKDLFNLSYVKEDFVSSNDLFQKLDDEKIRAKRSRISGDLSEIYEKEIEIFEKLDPLKFKDTTKDVISLDYFRLSEEEKKSDYNGYLLRDFIFDKFDWDGRPSSKNRDICINLIATKALILGKMSVSVTSRIYRIKGEIYSRQKNRQMTILMFENAVNLDESVGVKARLTKMKQGLDVW